MNTIARYIVKAVVSGMIFCLVMAILMAPGEAHGQEKGRLQLKAGNRAYFKGDFGEAEKHYRTALGKDKGSLPGNYNLGGALYRQDRFGEAYDHYRFSSDQASDSVTRSRVFYNAGNAAIQRYLSQEEEANPKRPEFLRQAIEAYSRALRFNPGDEDARYNLSRALMMQRKEEQQPKSQQQEEQKERDQKKQEQQMPETEKREEKKKQREPEEPEGRISREDAERILNAIREKEMKTAEMINERERRKSASGKQKDW